MRAICLQRVFSWVQTIQNFIVLHFTESFVKQWLADSTFFYKRHPILSYCMGGGVTGGLSPSLEGLKKLRTQMKYFIVNRITNRNIFCKLHFSRLKMKFLLVFTVLLHLITRWFFKKFKLFSPARKNTKNGGEKVHR